MLNKPVGMRFIIADTTALLHMGSGDFVLPVPLRAGILSGGILSGGIMSRGIMSRGILSVSQATVTCDQQLVSGQWSRLSGVGLWAVITLQTL